MDNEVKSYCFCGRYRQMHGLQQMAEECPGFGAYLSESLTLALHESEVSHAGSGF